MPNPQKVKQYLTSHGIDFILHEHEPVFTCEQAANSRNYNKIRGIHSKNLFIKDRRAKNFYLVILPLTKTFDIKQLGETLNQKLKFANQKELLEILDIEPGAVSIFGLINDTTHKVQVLIDKTITDADFVSFHPNINTETLELSQQNFQKYLTSIKNKIQVVD
jgi:Ala-tRNA(Pro) deacylase